MLYPAVDEAFGILGEHGTPMMNGSGASLYLACDSRRDAERIRKMLPRHLHGLVARSLNDIRDY